MARFVEGLVDVFEAQALLLGFQVCVRRTYNLFELGLIFLVLIRESYNFIQRK